MEIIWFTLVGITAYFGADWILRKIEQKRGEQLPNRNLVYFVIIMSIVLVSFQIIQGLIAPNIATTETAISQKKAHPTENSLPRQPPEPEKTK